MQISSSMQTSYLQNVNRTSAVRSASAYESIAPTNQQQDKLSIMQEKYKDVYTPMPETYSKNDEKMQQQKIYEAYPDYISPQDLLKLADKYYQELGGEPLQLGVKITPQQSEKQHIAANKALNEIGGIEYFKQMMKGTEKIKDLYPVNEFAKDGYQNAKELTRFTNAAVYEGLESGLSVKEAKGQAKQLIGQYLDQNYNREEFLKSRGETDITPFEKDPILFGSNSGIWDLREYGINGRWEENNIYQNDKAMVAEIQKKIGEFNFMLQNKELMEEANSEINIHSQKQIHSYQSRITDYLMPKSQIALNIFENYKIFDSINVKA